MESEIRQCRQCGFEVVAGSGRPENIKAQEQGFCCWGCQEAYEEYKRLQLSRDQ